MIWLIVLLMAVWVYLLRVLRKAKLDFFRFLVGSVGAFIFLVVLVRPIATVPLTKAVAATAGVFGQLTGMYETYYQYAMLFIRQETSSISLYVDYECSGIIEIMAFSAMLWFFPLYNLVEKIAVNIVGLLWIFASNILRLFVVCALVYAFGNDMYFFAHTIFGRIVFYGLSILLYFYVFTRSQIVRQKVGRFRYDSDTESNRQ